MTSKIHTQAGTLALAAALGLAATGAQAGDLGYTYVEGGYQDVDVDDVDADGDGFTLGGSIALTDMFHLFGGFGTAELDVDGFGDVDYDTWEVGGGINYGIASNADLVGRLSYVSAEVDAGFADADDDGYRLYGGVRGRLASPFELEGGISYTDLDDSGDDTAFVGAGRYYFTDQWAAGLSVNVGDDVTVWGLNVRWEMASR